MREAFRQVWANPYVRVLVYLLLFYLAFRLLQKAWPALQVLLTAFAFAYLTHPLVRFFEARRLPRVLGVVLVYLGLGLFLGLTSFLTAQTVVELSRLAQELPRLLDPLWAWLLGLPDRIQAVPVPESLKPVLAEASRNMQGLLQGFLETLLRFVQGLLGQGGNLLAGLARC
jgi:predicted PurR-regulated permease PerM